MEAWCAMSRRVHLVRIVPSTLSPEGLESNSRAAPKSPNAVVDHDGDRLDGDSECRHPDQDGRNPSTAIVDDEPESLRRFRWQAPAASRSRIFLFVIVLTAFASTQSRTPRRFKLLSRLIFGGEGIFRDLRKSVRPSCPPTSTRSSSRRWPQPLRPLPPDGSDDNRTEQPMIAFPAALRRLAPASLALRHRRD